MRLAAQGLELSLSNRRSRGVVMSSATVTLKVFSGGQCIATHRMARELVKIGRLPTSHLRLEDDAIARMHAVLELSGNELRLVDLGSATGTMVNGVPVERSMVVHQGDRLEFGPYSVFVDIEALPTASTPAAASAPRAARPESHAIDPASVEHTEAPAVAQVIARWNRSVLDVQHVGHARRGRVDASAWMALGALLSLGGAAVFASEVTQDWSSYQSEARAAADAGRPIPSAPGHGAGGLGIALALAGLVPLGIGMVRRKERPRSNYVIGERPDASLTVAGEGIGEGFELVERSDRGVTLRLLPSMHGQIEQDGVVHRIDALAASAPTRELSLASGAKAQVHYGALSFDVAAVPPGRVAAGRSATDKPYWIYNAASFVVIGGILGLSQLVPQDQLAFQSDENLTDSRYVGFLHQPDEQPEVPPDDEADSPDSKNLAGLSGERHVGDEGQAGNPSSKVANKMYASKGPKDAMPTLARDFDPDRDARDAGILGMARLEQGGFLASPYASAFQVGNDDEDLWGNISGDQLGEASGFGGLGLVGPGRGGGGTGEGTIGLTGIGLIGQRGANGDRLGYGNRNGEGKTDAFAGRKKRVPVARIARGETVSGIDKEIIRRVVRAHINEVRGCYGEGLTRDPNLHGRVAISFTIGASGNVSASAVAESSLGDARVETCVAKAVRRWRFSMGTTGGSAMVTYPFVLNPG
jgi:TonB family protein